VENVEKLSAMNVNGIPLEVLCSGSPIYIDKPHILASAVEPIFSAI
jgi:hypothetical protein